MVNEKLHEAWVALVGAHSLLDIALDDTIRRRGNGISATGLPARKNDVDAGPSRSDDAGFEAALLKRPDLRGEALKVWGFPRLQPGRHAGECTRARTTLCVFAAHLGRHL